jgi:predicted metal-dependent HD superfamily phosphohydrolase
MDLRAASAYIIDRLGKELHPSLSYHCAAHSLDVLEATKRLAASENIDPHSTAILETVALFHDAGMMIQYRDHETASARLAMEVLPQFGYSKPEIGQVEALIMVTKLPQRPYTHLEQIICDADLDYLGRDDFFVNSFRLKLEWKLNGISDNNLAAWFASQITFLSEHQYFTKSAIRLREEEKQRHLAEIRGICLQHRDSATG